MSCPLTMLSTASQQKAPMDSAGGGNNSSVDARTKETAATLLGVAAFNNGPPKTAAPAPTTTITKPTEVPSDNRPTPTSILDHPSTQPQQQQQQPPTVVPHHPPPAPRYAPSAAGPPPSYHLHPPPPPPPTYHNARPPHQVETAAHHLSATTTATATTEANTALSMSSIGFGIDSSGTASWGDATDAAVRALQDAMERSTLRLPMTMPSQHLLQIKVQLGVPSKQLGSHEPMVVDVNRLTAILPRAIPVLPIRVVVGGLYIAGETPGSPSICTAVACVTLQSLAPFTVPEPSPARSQVPANISQSSPWASLEGHTPVSAAPAPGPTSAAPPAAVVAAGPPPQSAGDIAPSVMATRQTTVVPSAPVPAATIATTPAANGNVHRSSSIEMLARISEEIRVAGDNSNQKPPNGFVAPSSIADGQATAAIQQQHLGGDLNGYDVTCMDFDEAQFRNGNYNYKKLPPGITTKNNRRLFVKHQYRDHSFEKPLPEERDLVGNHPGASPSARTPNAAFPLKLHETLSQIENNGHSDIIGWMPHGRSFKIHKQKEFAEIILPRYFVMTKKSSFLRQLNLYGFNRFSAGLDQGSYYHEKFLRGMKFLCRRMTRQKVNGNRIRSAGNPDEEPDLTSFPSCPNPQAPSSKMTNNFIMPPISSETSTGTPSSDGQQRAAAAEAAAAAEDSEEYDDEKSDASPANGALQKATAV